MSVTDIIAKIKSDAEDKISSIVKDTSARVTGIEKNAELLKEQLTADWEKKRDIEVERERQSILAQARQSAQIQVQTAKRKAVNVVLAKVYKNLCEESDVDYESRYKKIIQDTSIENNVVSVRAPKSRLDVTKKILEHTNIEATIVDDPSIDAGLLLVSENVQYDFTLKRLFIMRKPDLEVLIAKTLFKAKV